MSWNIVDHITIYRNKEWYAAHPNVVRTPNGDLLTIFHRSTHLGHSHHGHPLFDLRACRSQDDGKTWHGPELISCDPRGGIVDFGTHVLKDESIFLHASTVELVPQGDSTPTHTSWLSRPGIPYWIRSRDNGRTWSDPKRFPRLPDCVWGHPSEHSGVCRSQLIELDDGRILLPSKATDVTHEFRYFGMMRISRDLGENWEYGGRIAEDPIAHFSEPAMYRTPGGRLLVLFRLHPRLPNDKIARLALVTSDDDGETWTPWRRTTIKGCPGHLLGLRDGRIFATVGTRWDGQQGCMARILEPEASDLDEAPDVVVRSDSNETDCGYPWAIQLQDDRVLVVYYYTYPDGGRGIEGTILEERS
jgi:hypothetical protein